jgi:HlyD family secretion protein
MIQMKKTLRNGLIIAITVIALGLLPSCGGGNATANQIVKVQKGDISVTVASDGNLALINDRKLTFQTGGLIKTVSVKEGDRVKTGQVLATIDTEPLELIISSASLAVRAAEIDLQTAKNAYEKITYPYSFSTFNISVPDSLNSMAEAQRNIDDIRDKIAKGINQNDLYDIQHAVKQATDALNAARDRLKISEGQNPFAGTTTVSAGGFSNQVPTYSVANFWVFRETELAVNKAQLGLDKAKNDLKQASDELPKTVITAPFDGVVSQVNVKEGDNLSSVESSSKVIFYLVDPVALELKGTVDEIDVAKIALGQKTDITLDALPDAKIPGELTYIAPVSRVEGGVVVYDVKIRLENKESLNLKSGMTAKADIVTEKKTGVLTIPDRAIIESNGNATVKIMVDGKLQEKQIKTGITDGINTEVLSGLNEGDEVIIEKKA